MKWNVLQLVDCSILRPIPVTGTSSLLWLLLISHNSLLLRLMGPSVRPPQLRCVSFSSVCLPCLLVPPATFWTSMPFATLSIFPGFICDSYPSGQGFAYGFFQILSRGRYPCCSTVYFIIAYARLELSPIGGRPCWVNKMDASCSHTRCLFLTLWKGVSYDPDE